MGGGRGRREVNSGPPRRGGLPGGLDCRSRKQSGGMGTCIERQRGPQRGRRLRGPFKRRPETSLEGSRGPTAPVSVIGCGRPTDGPGWNPSRGPVRTGRGQAPGSSTHAQSRAQGARLVGSTSGDGGAKPHRLLRHTRRRPKRPPPGSACFLHMAASSEIPADRSPPSSTPGNPLLPRQWSGVQFQRRADR